MPPAPPSFRRFSRSIRKSSGAFSVAELLATITIIAVVAATAVSLTGTARLKADVTKSVSNLRNITVASLMFANDHGGKIALDRTPQTPTRTQGCAVEPRANQMPRVLYNVSSPFGGHALGGGDYPQTSMVFHNPRLTAFKKPTNPQEEFGRSPNGAQAAGYYYYSFPTQADSHGRGPLVVRGYTFTNDRPSACWERTPLYSDVPDPDLVRDYGLKGNEFVVAHLDGSVSVRSKQRVPAQSCNGARIYYMATGEDC